MSLSPCTGPVQTGLNTTGENQQFAVGKFDTLLESALGYATLGWRVMPSHHIVGDGACSCQKGPECGRSAGKHPRIKSWQREASANPAAIHRWWTQWPNANISILTGPESGIFDLEVEEEGLVDLALLQQGNGELPRTPRAASGHGGLHQIFRWPGDGRVVTTGSHLDKKPIDTRGRGGQFVAPPSRNTGGQYRWIISPHEAPPAEAPAWLLRWLHDNGRLERLSPSKDSNGKMKPHASLTGPLTVEQRAILYLGSSFS